MQISILAVQSTTQTSKAGKPYQQLEVTFKNLTFNKVESKKLMPFGVQKPAFDALANASAGAVFEVTVVKNAAGYNDWTACVQAPPGTIAPADNPATGMGSINMTGGKTVQVKSTYETPEERAKKQVYIIRQSSISAAIASLSVGAKAALKPADVLDLAEDYFTWVMQSPQDAVKQDLFEVDNDTEVM
jgi:hypothetical protein